MVGLVPAWDRFPLTSRRWPAVMLDPEQVQGPWSTDSGLNLYGFTCVNVKEHSVQSRTKPYRHTMQKTPDHPQRDRWWRWREGRQVRGESLQWGCSERWSLVKPWRFRREGDLHWSLPCFGVSEVSSRFLKSPLLTSVVFPFRGITTIAFSLPC